MSLPKEGGPTLLIVFVCRFIHGLADLAQNMEDMDQEFEDLHKIHEDIEHWVRFSACSPNRRCGRQNIVLL